ncbi:MAG: ATP-binding cassette domain-containing protein [Neisseriaceae bacterium]
MAIITIDKAKLAFGHHVLLDEVSFGIEKGDKIGLIGRNGSGKSSLLKAIANTISLDDGKIYVADGVKIYYVLQEPIFKEESTVFEDVFSSLNHISKLLDSYYNIINQLQQSSSDDLLSQLHLVQEQLEQQNGWEAKNLIDRILSELKLDGTKKISILSGGTKKKVAIAKALVTKPDVILLDEPTNHLDIYAIEWLEKVIQDFNGSVLLITHDRAFLNKTANKILELDRGRLRSYPGSFEKYQALKEQQLNDEGKSNREFDKFLAQEEAWIRKGIEARRTRNEGRVRRLEELRKQRNQRRDRVGNVNFQVDSGNTSGKIVAKLNNISIKFDENKIIDNYTTTIMRGDKIGLIGANGIGKSTLLKIILGKIKADLGFVELGTKLEIAYFDQMREALDDEATIADVVSQGQDYVEINGRKLHIATYLEEFLFEPALFRSPVKSLSGGERNRLLLARLFSRKANVLVLDEPTNDLDVETLELLESLLEDYSGTVFLVSHDRTFLDNVVTQSLIFLGDGKILELVGGYSDWLEYKTNYLIEDVVTNVKTIQIKQAGDTEIDKKDRVTSKSHTKLSYKEKQQLEILPRLIEDLEKEQKDLNDKLLDTSLYKTEALKMVEYQKRLSEIDEEILSKLALWEELEQKLSK